MPRPWLSGEKQRSSRMRSSQAAESKPKPTSAPARRARATGEMALYPEPVLLEAS